MLPTLEPGTVFMNEMGGCPRNIDKIVMRAERRLPREDRPREVRRFCAPRTAFLHAGRAVMTTNWRQIWRSRYARATAPPHDAATLRNIRDSEG
jgi:hypothetical protein